MLLQPCKHALSGKNHRHSRDDPMPETMNFVYILSCSYSGSTLLTLLLDTHPRISTVGELKAAIRIDPNSYKCSCGYLMRQCPFWTDLRRILAESDVTLDLQNFGTHFRTDSSALYDRILRASVRNTGFESLRRAAITSFPKLRHEFQRILRTNRIFVDSIKRIGKGDVFLDSSKDPVRLLYLLQSGYWGVKVIHLIRDGRAVACSHMKHEGVSMREAVREWRVTHEESRRIRSRFSQRNWLSVCHEDICRSPKSKLETIFRFLGLDGDSGTLEFRSVEHHIRGNRMRLGMTSQIRLDESWKSTLTERDLREFDSTGGETNRSCGYS